LKDKRRFSLMAAAISRIPLAIATNASSTKKKRHGFPCRFFHLQRDAD
jgi:hypothetical protein